LSNPLRGTSRETLSTSWLSIGRLNARRDGPDGNPGSSLAVGFLVPMLGFGLNGLWAVTHATFPPRSEAVEVTTSRGEIGQNAEHG